MKHTFWLLSFFCLNFISAQAQYDPSKIFIDDFYAQQGNLFRSASGKPGPKYWQNEADYTISASFNPQTHILKGKVEIDYTNNSPDELNALWLQLDQNKAKANSRVNHMQNPSMTPDSSKGYAIEQLTLTRSGKKKITPFKVFGTRLQIRLKKNIAPGETIALSIAYSFEQPKDGGRSGYMESEDGQGIYEFAYWYPRMCVYDDYYGWNTLPFIGGGEMYLDYGTIDYKITVPANQVVVGSGVLMNKEEILNKKTLRRLEKASASNQTIMIRKINEIASPVTKEEKGLVTWHFKMKNTRDVAWAMSSSYIWDAAKINLKDGKTALAQSFYPPKSTKKDRGWPRSTQMLKASVEFFSDFVLNYPYKTASSVAGAVGGMEFPGLAFNHWSVNEEIMYLLAAHEIGHTWFPMVIGSDERRSPFMDEGFNTFVDVYAEEAFNNGEFAPKRDGEYAPGGGNPAEEIIKVIAATKNGPTIMTAPDNMAYKHVHPLHYFKTAFGLVLLREVILGHDRFDYAFQQYAKTWAFKHPRPLDFFRSMENNTGEDLRWFWEGWFYHNWQLDQAITSVSYSKNDPTKGATVTISNNKQMVMPILIQIEEENGKIHTYKIPVDIWRYGKNATLNIDSHSKIKRIELDAKAQLPDIDRTNNVWQG